MNQQPPPYTPQNTHGNTQTPYNTASAPCRHEFTDPYYPCCAYSWFILFPIGLLCFLKMKVKTCVHCDMDVPVDNIDKPVPASQAYRTGLVIGAIGTVI
jgi:hypothetical protein